MVTHDELFEFDAGLVDENGPVPRGVPMEWYISPEVAVLSRDASFWSGERPKVVVQRAGFAGFDEPVVVEFTVTVADMVKHLRGPNAAEPIGEPRKIAWQITKPKAGLLAKFAAIHRASTLEGLARAVQVFARQWGVLGICYEHGEPALHADHSECADGVERLRHWYRWSRFARATLAVASEIRGGRLAPEGEVGELAGRQGAGRFPTIGSQRQLVASRVNLWVESSGIHPVLRWGAGDLSPSMSYAVEPSRSIGGRPPGRGNLFGALGMELLLAVTQQPMLYSCDGCGVLFTKGSRRPKEGQRKYCRPCRDAHVPAKDWQRRQRQSARTRGK